MPAALMMRANLSDSLCRCAAYCAGERANVAAESDIVQFESPFDVQKPAGLVAPSNYDLSDTAFLFYPDLWRARQEIANGSPPLWNPNVGAGRPLLASQQFAPLYPPQWLAFLLPFWRSLAYIAALKLLIAAVGTYLFCRRALKLHRAPALLAGTVFSLSPYVISWLQYSLANAWVLLPWLLLLGARVCRGGRALDTLGLSVLIGVLLFAGQPEAELIMLVALAAYVGFELVGARRDEKLDRRGLAARAALPLVALIAGLLLAAIFTLPFLEFLSNAFDNPRGGPPPPGSIIYSWVFPELWGTPGKLFEAANAPGNFQERTAYAGALPLLLALGGLAVRPRRGQFFFVALGVFALCTAMPTPVNSLVRALPRGNYSSLTRALAVIGVLTPLYDQSTWPYLDRALTLADRNNGALLLRFSDLYLGRNADGTYDNQTDANTAVNCIDRPVPTDIAAYDALGPKFASASALFGPAFQYSNLACAYWPAKPTGIVGPITAQGAPPILLVGGTGDPATPYAWAQSVNQQLAGSVLLTREGNGHVSYDKSTCAKALINAYLIDLTLPAAGTVCR